MKKKAAIFCSHGLGDGLIFLMIANNLKLNGFDVCVYHNFLKSLKSFVKNYEIKKFPKKEEVENILKDFDFFIVNSDYSDINIKIKKCLNKDFSKKKWILHATTSKGKNLPGDIKFDIKKTILENLKSFCRDKLNIKNPIKENNLFKRENLIYRKYKRIVIHPSAKNENRRWGQKRFLKLSKKLENLGYSVFFLLTKEEKKSWENVDCKIVSFESLEDVASYVYESSFVIGNNSGIGHLASSLKIPTFIIFASKREKLFWRPDFFMCSGVCPLSFLPNIKNMRLNRKYWKNLIFVSRAFKKFKKFEKRFL